jgi:hypothetical protein
MTLRSLGPVFWALLALASGLGCSKRTTTAEKPTRASVGKPCTSEGQEVCLGPTEAIVCVDGKYETMPCRDAPCSSGPQGDLCEDRTHLAGEYCEVNAAQDDFWKHGCSVDGRSQLRCVGKRWQLEKACPGKHGCRRVEVRTDRGHESRLECDERVTDTGAACSKEGEHACGSDAKSTVRCSGGTWQDDQRCRGPRGCVERGDQVQCDDTLAEVGDRCGDDGDRACSTDRKARLECKGHKMAFDKQCKSECAVVTDKVQRGKPGPGFECE